MSSVSSSLFLFLVSGGLLPPHRSMFSTACPASVSSVDLVPLLLSQLSPIFLYPLC